MKVTQSDQYVNRRSIGTPDDLLHEPDLGRVLGDVEMDDPSSWRCFTEQVASDTERGAHAAAESRKDGGKLDYATGMLGASLTAE
jgi:hypothetical protein